jgi:hypothetical protein
MADPSCAVHFSRKLGNGDGLVSVARRGMQLRSWRDQRLHSTDDTDGTVP